MAIKIQTKKTGIPVIIGDLELVFEATDESVATFLKNAKKVERELDEIKSDSPETAKVVLKKAFDTILGEGTFDKVYEITPSVFIMTDYFIQIVEGLVDEFNKLGLMNKRLKKYLNKK